MANVVAMTGTNTTLMPNLDEARRAIAANIVALEIAFPAGRSRDKDERDVSAAIYMQAISGIEPAIVVHVLKALRYHNPRNPFPPTPQDVYESSNKTVGALRSAVLTYGSINYQWPPSSNELPRGWFANVGASLFEPTCIVSDALATTWLSEAFRHAWPDNTLKQFLNFGWRDLESAGGLWSEQLQRLRQFNKLPAKVVDLATAATVETALAHLDKLQGEIASARTAEKLRREQKYGRQIFSNAEFDNADRIGDDPC
ncbi:MAG: hypothetical protein CTY31_12300 [Hyphomicrobium sp.]|nr:MAG: hypothetical protein CTY39_08110 [Hyphomicrobium sp.]PPC98793.1 MAG: hypothetical protein CTY31_12300 [Hyphomicrobium sp.]